METRSLGSLQATVVGLGCNNFGMRCDQAQTTAVIDACLEHGITFLDTADGYGGTKSEEFMGVALKGRRDQVVLATKFGMPLGEGTGGGSARWIGQAIEDSLRRLQTDRIDLYQLHFPDQNTPLDETIEALDRLVKAGKVVEIGCSNFTGELIDQASEISQKNSWARFVSAQNNFSLLQRGVEADVLPAAEKRGLGVLPYFPLASGVLTGKYKRGEAIPEGTRLAGMPAERVERFLKDETFDKVEALTAWAADHGHTTAELAIAWLAATSPVTSVIAGATKPEQVAANAKAGEWKLTESERSEVAALAG